MKLVKLCGRSISASAPAFWSLQSVPTNFFIKSKFKLQIRPCWYSALQSNSGDGTMFANDSQENEAFASASKRLKDGIVSSSESAKQFSGVEADMPKKSPRKVARKLPRLVPPKVFKRVARPSNFQSIESTNPTKTELDPEENEMSQAGKVPIMDIKIIATKEVGMIDESVFFPELEGTNESDFALIFPELESGITTKMPFHIDETSSKLAEDSMPTFTRKNFQNVVFPRSSASEPLLEKATEKKIMVSIDDKNTRSGTQNYSHFSQGSPEWLDLRKGKLTASAFSNALGFWGTDGRVTLWEEKIGIKEPFSGNDATEWGMSHETEAVQVYEMMTGNAVNHLAFQVYREGEDAHSWLGASPDGLLDPENSSSGGVLEVKCPFNKGQPETAVPYRSVPYYYIPQAQGLMEIFDRDWMDFYIWTRNGGSVVYRVERNREYWEMIYGILSEFWWYHVVPAKHALGQGNLDKMQLLKPPGVHPLTAKVKARSQVLAYEAVATWREKGGEFSKL